MAVLSHYAPRTSASGDPRLSPGEGDVESGMRDAENVLAAGFRLAKLVCKSENNKGKYIFFP
jgi:hypothetical protein